MIACGEKASERFRILLSVLNLLADASTDRPVNIFHIAFPPSGKKGTLLHFSFVRALVTRHR